MIHLGESVPGGLNQRTVGSPGWRRFGRLGERRYGIGQGWQLEAVG